MKRYTVSASEHQRNEAVRNLVTAATALMQDTSRDNCRAALFHAARAVQLIAGLDIKATEEALELCKRASAGEVDLYV